MDDVAMHGGVQINCKIIDRTSSLKAFYEAYFLNSAQKYVIQVGANDGVMCDPLRRFFVHGKALKITAALIEPIAFYFEKLQKLYGEMPNFSLYNVACGSKKSTLKLYFIDPAVADRMNGTGPANNWAHGQGSYDENIVHYWIERNRFRGENYISNIDSFHQAVKSVEVDVIKLSDVEIAKNCENLLVVIDTQGFELEVISGIDWDYPPAYIVFEDDMKSGPSPVSAYLEGRGFRYLCGTNDKVFVRADR